MSEKAHEVSIHDVFAHVQGEMEPVVKDRDNPFFKSNYATLLAIHEMLRPILAKHGVGYSQSVVHHDGEKWMETKIFAKGCDGVIQSEVPFSCVDQKPQGLGSAITYMRRYGLQCAFGIVVADADDDDDGNRANGNRQQVKDSPF